VKTYNNKYVWLTRIAVILFWLVLLVITLRNETVVIKGIETISAEGLDVEGLYIVITATTLFFILKVFQYFTEACVDLMFFIIKKVKKKESSTLKKEQL